MKILVSLVGAFFVVCGVYASNLYDLVAPQQKALEAPLSDVNAASANAMVLSTAILTIPNGTVWTTTTISSGGGSGATIVLAPSTPRPTLTLALYCNEDACTAHAASMDQARELLERIADRGMQIDVVVDQNCHPQRETIQRRPAEIAAIEASK